MTITPAQIAEFRELMGILHSVPATAGESHQDRRKREAAESKLLHALPALLDAAERCAECEDSYKKLNESAERIFRNEQRRCHALEAQLAAVTAERDEARTRNKIARSEQLSAVDELNDWKESGLNRGDVRAIEVERDHLKCQLAVIKDQQFQDREARENWMRHGIKLEKDHDELKAKLAAIKPVKLPQRWNILNVKWIKADDVIAAIKAAGNEVQE